MPLGFLAGGLDRWRRRDRLLCIPQIHGDVALNPSPATTITALDQRRLADIIGTENTRSDLVSMFLRSQPAGVLGTNVSQAGTATIPAVKRLLPVKRIGCGARTVFFNYHASRMWR